MRADIVEQSVFPMTFAVTGRIDIGLYPADQFQSLPLQRTSNYLFNRITVGGETLDRLPVVSGVRHW